MCFDFRKQLTRPPQPSDQPEHHPPQAPEYQPESEWPPQSQPPQAAQPSDQPEYHPPQAPEYQPECHPPRSPEHHERLNAWRQASTCARPTLVLSDRPHRSHVLDEQRKAAARAIERVEDLPCRLDGDSFSASTVRRLREPPLISADHGRLFRGHVKPLFATRTTSRSL